MEKTVIVCRDNETLVIKVANFDPTRSILAGEIELIIPREASAPPVAKPADIGLPVAKPNIGLPRTFIAALESAKLQKIRQPTIDKAVLIRNKSAHRAGRTFFLARTFREILGAQLGYLDAVYTIAAYGQHMGWWKISREIGEETKITFAEAK